MPALNFQERFAELVENGEKRQTIRRVRKRPIKPGDMLYLYTGMRTKRCRKLRLARCEKVESIRIEKYGGAIISDEGWIEPAFLQAFAEEDGFDSWEEMRDWFDKQYGLPFEGALIQG